MNKRLKMITTVFLILTFTVTLTGCGEVKKAEAAINNMFVAFKELDFDEAEKYVKVDEITISDTNEDEDVNVMTDQYMMMKALFGRLDHQIIGSEKIDKNTVVVTTEVTAVDMKPVLEDFLVNALAYAFENAFSERQPTEEESSQRMGEMFMESARKSDLSTVTTLTKIKVVKKDKEWKIVTDEEFVNAILGGGVDAAKELEDSFNTEE